MNLKRLLRSLATALAGTLVVFAIVIGALTGFIQNEIVWGPLRRRHVGTMQQMIVTIGLSMALQYTFQFFFGGDIKGIVKSVPDSFQLINFAAHHTRSVIHGRSKTMPNNDSGNIGHVFYSINRLKLFKSNAKNSRLPTI